MKYLTLNRVFAVYLVLFVLIVAGIVPRSAALFATAFLLLWVSLAPLEEGVLFFVRSVPLFIAIPLTATYDNLNMWRPLALMLLVRLLIDRHTWRELARQREKTHPTTRRLAVLFILAGASLFVAAHPIAGIVRIIYFLNLLMVPTILFVLLRRGVLTTERVIKNISIPVIIVVIAGFAQLASTYMMDIYQFMRLWGEGIQLRQFGSAWSYIAVHVGNTWLAYYGPQLSLRVFSLFPDSHTFPLYVLLGIPALMAISLEPVLRAAGQGIRVMVRTRARFSMLWIPASLLIVILSGTRGIWAASIAVMGLAVALYWFMKYQKIESSRRAVFGYLSLFLVVYILLFSIAWPIFISPQFLLGKGDWGLLGNRVRSIVDFGETSNALRLKIWKASVVSIAHHPFLGVGIGNFPVVLDQSIDLAKAGSTAHNLYLHVAAEMGILAALELVILLGNIWVACWRWFKKAQGPSLIYSAASLLFVPWVLVYLLTDAALFDERAFLGFAFTAALILANGEK